MAKVVRRLVTRLDDYDGWLLLSVFLLCLLGTVMVFGAASYRSEAVSGPWGHFYYLVNLIKTYHRNQGTNLEYFNNACPRAQEK